MSGESRPTASDQTAADEPAASTEPSWPLVPGDYVLGSATSAVAVCTLATQSLLPRLAGQPEIAIAGRVYTENIGIEKMVANLLSSPKLRVLVLCGR